jgi:hypothetical protein
LSPSWKSYGVTWATSANIAMTSWVLRASRYSRASWTLWVPQLALSIPQVAVAAVVSTKAPAGRDDADALTLINGVWASLLFIDATVNAIRDRGPAPDWAKDPTLASATSSVDVFLGDTVPAALQKGEQRVLLNVSGQW